MTAIRYSVAGNISVASSFQRVLKSCFEVLFIHNFTADVLIITIIAMLDKMTIILMNVTMIIGGCFLYTLVADRGWKKRRIQV